MQHRPFVALGFVVACLGGAACQASDPDISSETAAIYGGTATTVGQYPTVVALSYSNGGLCTGTLITPRWVLTAAHCVTPGILRLPSQAAVTAATTVVIDSIDVGRTGGRRIAAKTTIPFPSFTRPGDNDVGLVELSEAITDRTPTAVNLKAASAPVGVMITAVGFGKTEAGTAGKQYALTSRTSSGCAAAGVSDATFLCFDQRDGKGKCQGDSGGPSFATVDGIEYVVGITSFGDQTCRTVGVDMRVDASATFLLQHVPELACGRDGACAAQCGTAGLPVDPDCPVCTTDADCGEQVCDGGHCVPAPGDPGGIGSVCDPECYTDQCATSGGDTLCTRACSAATPCPSGFDCAASGVCWPGDSGGCATGGGSGGGALLLVGLGLLVGLRRRRR